MIHILEEFVLTSIALMFFGAAAGLAAIGVQILVEIFGRAS